MKNHDDFCALNQDLPTIRPINYQKSCSIKTFLSSPMLSTEISIKPNLFQPYLWHIHFFFFFKTVNSADLCFKISPKTCRQYTKKLSSYSVLVLSYSWHCQICCHVWINIQNGYNQSSSTPYERDQQVTKERKTPPSNSM